MKKILVIGAGSIGLRHIACLMKLGETNIAVYRTYKGSIEQLPEEIRNSIILFTQEKDAFDWKPTHIIISNPTNLHLETYIKFYPTNASFLIEKPLFNSIEDIEIFNQLKSKKNKVVVGYNMRFHEIFKTIKNIIDSKMYGIAISASFQGGYYLPFWHPYEDYRLSYAARKELGGGVLRTLSHEIDIMLYLFGKTNRIFAKVEKISNLDIDVDDNVEILAKSDKCKNIYIHLDFIQPESNRQGYIVFTKGMLKYNFLKNEINFTSYDTKETTSVLLKKTDYNDQYLEQLTDFLYNKETISCNIEDGLQSIKIINACEISSKKGIEICLD